MAKFDLGITEIQMVSSLKPAYVIEVLDNLCNSLLWSVLVILVYNVLHCI